MRKLLYLLQNVIYLDFFLDFYKEMYDNIFNNTTTKELKMNLSREIKKLLNQNKVKNSVKTHYRTVYVTIKTPCSMDLIKQVKSMSTEEAHGSIMDDTRYYTGISVSVKFECEVSKETEEKVNEIISSWQPAKSWGYDFNCTEHHIEKQIKELGFEGLNYLDNKYLRNELAKRWGL